jgi:hypothetical protein
MSPLLFPGPSKTIGFLSLWYRFQRRHYSKFQANAVKRNRGPLGADNFPRQYFPSGGWISN